MERFVHFKLDRKLLAAVFVSLASTPFAIITSVLRDILRPDIDFSSLVVIFIPLIWVLISGFTFMGMMIIGIPVSLLSDWITYKFSDHWRRIFSALIHVGGAMPIAICGWWIEGDSKWTSLIIPITFMIIVSLSYWGIDEWIRRRQEKKQFSASQEQMDDAK